MSAQSVESILSKAMSDSAFADALFANPENALAGFDLTAEEKAKFKGLTRAHFDAMTPEERQSFAIVVHDRSPGSLNHNQSAQFVK